MSGLLIYFSEALLALPVFKQENTDAGWVLLEWWIENICSVTYIIQAYSCTLYVLRMGLVI